MEDVQRLWVLVRGRLEGAHDGAAVEGDGWSVCCGHGDALKPRESEYGVGYGYDVLVMADQGDAQMVNGDDLDINATMAE